MDDKTILEVVMEAAYGAKMDEATIHKLEALVIARGSDIHP